LDSWADPFEPEVLRPLIETVNQLLQHIIGQMQLDLAVLAAKKAQ
jgi:hypothetical protein